MAKVFVCHSKSDLEATSEIVDLLETALELPQGSVSSSALPGYSSDSRSDVELRQMLAASTIVFALVTKHSVLDTTFSFELGAAWAMGARVVPLLIDDSDHGALPWPVRNTFAVRPSDRAAWVSLVNDLAQLLGVRVRAASAARVAFDEVAARTSMPALPRAPEAAGARASVPPTPRAPSERSEIVSIAPVQAALSDKGAAVIAPSCELAFEAGRAVSDCVWNREEGLDFARELHGSLGRFIEALGGKWQDLSKLADLDLWIETTDNLLDGLPEAQRKLASWYELGYELTTLHNLASHDHPTTPEEHAEAEQLGQAALDRLLAHAEQAQIRYEQLGPLLSLLENLMAKPGDRDFTNIARSLDELRRHAVAADRLTTAA